MDALPSREMSIQETTGYKPSSSLTIHELPHTLDKSVDNRERLSRSSPGLVSR